MKHSFVLFLLACVIGFAGCASWSRGGIFYEAATPEARQALAARIGVLGAALRADSRFKEEVGRDYSLRFFGVKGTEFYGCVITYSPAAPGSGSAEDLLVVGCSYEVSHSDVGRRLRELIDRALGSDVLKLLNVGPRFSNFVQNRRPPNQAPERNDPSRHAGCYAPVAPAGVVAQL